MVRSDGKPYRKASQKGPRGGKTRNEVLRDKLRSRRRRLREQGLKELRFHAMPIEKARRSDGLAVYAIYKDGSEWVLTGLAATDEYEKMSPSRAKRSEIKVRGRWVVRGRSGQIEPMDGAEIDRFDTKADAVDYVSADGTSRVRSGHYVIRPEHSPRSRTETVDQDAFSDFQQTAFKVWE